MYLIIPSIDFFDNKCRTCIEGDTGTDEFYLSLYENPAELCKLFRLENVKSIHISDSDSFIEYNKNNFEKISKLPLTTSLPFQVYANYQSYDDCRLLLDSGIHRLVLPIEIIENLELLKKIINNYGPSRIIISYPITDILREEQDFLSYLTRSCNLLSRIGINRIQISFTEDIDSLANQEQLFKTIQKYFKRWTLQFNAVGYDELMQLSELMIFGMDSLVLGDSFYSKNFPCQQIWRINESNIDAKSKDFSCDF